MTSDRSQQLPDFQLSALRAADCGLRNGRDGGRATSCAHRETPPAVKRRDVWLLRVLVVAAFVALLYYYTWWHRAGTIVSLSLAFTAVWTLIQLAGSWVLYLAAHEHRSPPDATDWPTVDVFVTAYNEPCSLVRRSLGAACTMRGAHRTWLLDDGADPTLARLAQRLGAGYLTRDDRRDAKAGNINASLAHTSGAIVVIFDADHAPTPDFLERTLGHFADPAIGFVQVMLTFCNGGQSWVARAGEESSRDYYNPTAKGANGLGGATLVGSNALVRREALASIDGYRPGLAEDLATSIALHGAGWRSLYVAEPLAPGLAPPDLPAWFTQQLKWARGVFEVLLTDYPRLFPHLTWGQRLSYAVRMTYYWIGLVVGIQLCFTLAALFGSADSFGTTFEGYLVHIAPLAVATLLVRHVALRVWRHPSTPTGSLWRALFLVYVTWPIYILAWAMAILRFPLAFRLTPKVSGGVLGIRWMLPQIITLLLMGGGIFYALSIAHLHPQHPLVLCVAFLESIPCVLLFWAWMKTRRHVRHA